MRSSGRIAAGAGARVRAGGAGRRGDAAGARVRASEVRGSADRAGDREDAADELAFVRSGRAGEGFDLAFFGEEAMIPNEVRFGMLEDLRS
jgi:hypothetical protein